MLNVDLDNEEYGHPMSTQLGSETLPPPNRFKKNKNLNLISDPDQLKRIQAYKRTYRRKTVENDHELSRSPSSSPKLNADDWRSVFQMRIVLHGLTDDL